MLINPGIVKTDIGGVHALIDVQTSVTGMLEQTEKHFFNSHAEVPHLYDESVMDW